VRPRPAADRAHRSAHYPIIDYFRYFAEIMDEYMRQYRHLSDWPERPFNRLERAQVYRAAKGVSNPRSFGSKNVPVFVFSNAAFPMLDEERRPYHGRQIGIEIRPATAGGRNSRAPSSTSAA
jgi:hypothetical protein